MRRVSGLAGVVAVAAFTAPLGAQRSDPHAPRLSTLPGRPLHVRVALADAVAIGTVDVVEMGRIHVREVQPLVGDVGSAFELKRAPSNPPPLDPGDRALLLLRGARPPYVLVDEPSELAKLEDEQAEVRWLRALRRAAQEPQRVRNLYWTWLDAPSEDLQREGLRGLQDASAHFTGEAVERLVALAADPDAPTDLCLAAATLASRSAEGVEALLAGLLDDGASAHPEVLVVALRAARLQRHPELDSALLRALRHTDPRIRRAALQPGPSFAREPRLRRELERLAGEDPDADVRAAAKRTLRRTEGLERELGLSG